MVNHISYHDERSLLKGVLGVKKLLLAGAALLVISVVLLNDQREVKEKDPAELDIVETWSVVIPIVTDICARSDNSLPSIMSERFVKRALIAPSSAVFPRFSEVRQSYLGNCTWEVLSYVDAQNAFGAMVRSDYLITMEYNPDSKLWSGVDLQLPAK